MFEGFALGILARVIRLFAFIAFIGWVLNGFSWFWAVVTLALLTWSSWLKYQSTQTVRIRD